MFFSDHNGMKLEINSKKNSKFTNIWKIINTFSNNKWVKEETKIEIRKYLGIDENWQYIETYRMKEKYTVSDGCSAKYLHLKRAKIPK
jgi:hypothetical protein